MFDAKQIQKFQSLPTPFYFYDVSLLEQTLTAAKAAAQQHGYKVHYALKANAEDRILSMIRDHGFGADCVSGNEVAKAIETGFAPAEIFFAGVGKTDDEIRTGLEHGIFCFNCESMSELSVLDELAGAAAKSAGMALRINPNIDARTHRYITTGLEENKFGINVFELSEAIGQVQRLENLNLLGLHFHIGSQITHMRVFKGLCLRVNEIQRWFDERQIPIPHLNLGGGLGVDYRHPNSQAVPDFESYFGVFKQFLEARPDQTLHFELGRALVAQCGSLISRVVYVKRGMRKNFVILDAGMTDLLRPALYQSYHKIENLTSRKASQKYDVVGPVCESSDTFGKEVSLPEVRRGDLVAIRTTGAYGQVMASRYNLRDLPRSVYSDTL